MLSSQYFSLPLLTRDQARTLCASHVQPNRHKRRRIHPTEKEDLTGTNEHAKPDEARESPVIEARNARPISSSAITADPESAEQYRVAGYSGNEPLPVHFPHRSLDTDTQPPRNSSPNSEANLHGGLSQLSPPLFISTSSHVTSLRLHHLSVLTTVMYRCLLEGDYTRAGRAWGLLLRTEMRSRAVDLRPDGRWGIGAEVLLREGLPSEVNQDLDESSDSDMDDVGKPTAKDRPISGTWFNREGFAKAKEYYERLILQYPYDKRWASKVNSLHFYLAMFGLWIYVTQQEREKGWTRIAQGPAEDVAWDQEQPSPETAEEIRGRELLEAESIASRMDELVLSPPYLDSPELWHLRGMVALWMADLYLPAVSAFSEGGDKDIDGPVGNAHGTDLARRNDELNRAKSAFQKAHSTGGSVWEGFSRLAHNVEDYTEDV